MCASDFEVATDLQTGEMHSWQKQTESTRLLWKHIYNHKLDVFVSFLWTYIIDCRKVILIVIEL